MVQRLFEGSTDAVQVDGMDGRVVYANGAWLSLFRVDADEALGAKWSGMVKDRLCKPAALSSSWSRCKKGNRAKGVVALKMDGGGQQQVSYTRAPMWQDDGEVWGVLSIFRLEGLQPGNQELADATHDLTNVFTAIMAGAQLIERQNSDTPGLVAKSDLINRSAQRGLQLLKKFGPGVA